MLLALLRSKSTQTIYFKKQNIVENLGLTFLARARVKLYGLQSINDRFGLHYNFGFYLGKMQQN